MLTVEKPKGTAFARMVYSNLYQMPPDPDPGDDMLLELSAYYAS